MDFLDKYKYHKDDPREFGVELKDLKKDLEKTLTHIIQRKPLKRDLKHGKSLSLEN